MYMFIKLLAESFFSIMFFYFMIGFFWIEMIYLLMGFIQKTDICCISSWNFFFLAVNYETSNLTHDKCSFSYSI